MDDEERQALAELLKMPITAETSHEIDQLTHTLENALERIENEMERLEDMLEHCLTQAMVNRPHREPISNPSWISMESAGRQPYTR